MGFIRIFRTPNPKKFNFNPRYYDPEEEEKQERRARQRKLSEKGAEGAKERISSSLRHRGGYRADQSVRRRALFRSNMILLASLVFLILLGYGLLKIYLPEIMEALG